MSGYNPYEPPHAGQQLFPTEQVSGGVPPEIVQILQQTRPWLLFLSILGFLFTGLMVLGGISVTALGAMANSAMPAWIGPVYLVLGVIYLFPALFLFRCTSSIERLSRDPRMDALANALGHQRSFWRFVGIMMIVLMAVYFLVIVGMVGYGVSRGLHPRGAVDRPAVSAVV